MRFLRPVRGAAGEGLTAAGTAPDRPAARDRALIRSALVVAGGALRTRDVPIGAVVVDSAGRRLAAAANARVTLTDPTAHAEILVLRAAAKQLGTWNLSGCTMGVTCEPCTMCAGALVAARIERLVFGCWEPKTGAAGSLWDLLRDRRLPHRVQVRGGVLETECAAVLRDFFAAQR